MADLAELFARLKNPNTGSHSPPASTSKRQSEHMQHQSTGYQQPFVSSPIVSPPPQGPYPRHPEHILSANATPNVSTPMQADQARPEQTTSLLSLLNASSTAVPHDSNAHTSRHHESNAPVSASDLVASFARSTASPSRLPDAFVSPGVTPLHAPKAAVGSSANPQDMLLTLLKRSDSASHTRDSSGGKAEIASPLPDRRSSNNATPVRSFGMANAASPSSFEPQMSSVRSSQTNYRNPFSPSHVMSKADSEQEEDRDVPSSVQPVAKGASGAAEEVPSPNEASHELSGTHLKNAVREAAVELTEELRDGKTKHELEEQVSKPVAAALQSTANAVAAEGLADTWETAESDESRSATSPGYAVRVFSLPMRPFVSLEVSGSKPPPSLIRPEVVMKIASLKKEFDQVDRTLATASGNHIVYAMTKGGGFRIIRQDDGSNKTVYRGSDNQVFNISINGSPSSEFETVLATGVNGSVFWTAVSAKVDITSEDLAKRSFTFPPPPSPDENTSTAQLKTRAKKSSRHPAFFAYGRSKTIYLVWPNVAQSEPYMDSKKRVVDSVKYLNERCVCIATGKAGKDFTFSEDDTVIVSLDKHGKLKFWDIGDYISSELEYRIDSHSSVELKDPIMTLWVSSNSQRAWPTSVHFVDKDRPTSKGLALRYMLVGLKQNHTIQLWDLGLGKAVQELNLPHKNETDAICSIAYHSKSGIIAVGHPTRNSLYLIHLSAPKYNLPQMTQAKFVRALVAKDKGLPRPESTAIMSGLREIALGPIGDLRSIDIIPSSPSATEERGQEEETVFEVYTMHSKGVTCLNLKRRDFGWGSDGKAFDALDAENQGVVSVSELQTRASAENGEQDEAITRAPEAPKLSSKPSAKVESRKDSEATAPRTPQPMTPNRTPQAAAPERSEKKKKKRAEEIESSVVAPAGASNPQNHPEGVHQPLANAKVESSTEGESQIAVGVDNGVNRILNTNGEAPNSTVAGQSYVDILTEQMTSLYRRIDEDKRVLDATGSARQDAVLRLVSSTLTDNVEKSLSQIVSKSIEDSVLPSLAQVTVSTMDQKLGQVMSQQMGQAVPREIKAALPEAVSKTLQSPQTLQNISNAVSAKLTSSIEKQLATTLQNQLSSMISGVAAEAAAKAAQEASHRMLEQAKEGQRRAQQDAVKIDQLSQAIGEMTSTVASMATIQAELQREVMLLRSEVGRQSQPLPGSRAPATETQDAETESIAHDIEEGRLEQGTIKWLQSQKQDLLFTKIFRALDPAYLRNVNQIVVLSVAASVSQRLADKHLAERLAWLEVSLATVDARSSEIASFAPKMMDILIDRLSEEYMRLSDAGGASSRVLSRIHTLVRRAKEIKTFTSGD